MGLRDAVKDTINFIEENNKNNLFAEDLKIIEETKYRTKRWYDIPGTKFSTTWGARYVKLYKGFDKTKVWHRAVHLIHEQIHERQYKRMGKIKFLASYLLKRSGRYKLEMEAFKRQMEYMNTLTRLSNVDIMYIASKIHKNYHLFGYKSVEETFKELNDHLTESIDKGYTR